MVSNERQRSGASWDHARAWTAVSLSLGLGGCGESRLSSTLEVDQGQGGAGPTADGGHEPEGGGREVGPEADAQTHDAQTRDAQTRDAQTRDAQTPDAQTPDAQPPDAQPPDAQAFVDAADPDSDLARDGSPDAEVGRDAQVGDALASLDIGVDDAARPDQGEADAQPEPDAAPEPRDAAPEVDAAPDPPLPACPAFDPPVVTGNLADPAVTEASGVAESWRNHGVLWVHNDSGDVGRVFALDTAGATLGVYELDGPRPRDNEDLSVGPGPDPQLTYVYVGDVGDNFSQRANIQVRRFPEPLVPRGAEPALVRLAGVELFTLVYPDGPHNCETMMVDGRTGDVYVVVKSADGLSPVYRAAAPLNPAADNPMERVASLTFGPAPLGGGTLTTGGDVARTGEAIIIRTYGAAYLWRRGPRATIGEALGTAPCPLPLAREQQGEAIGFAANGLDYYTVSEGANTPVQFYRRR